VGPVRGVHNYWVACAVMAGFSQGGGIGLVLSRWMAENDPGQDILSMDVARFGAFATPKYTSLKVPENYSRRFRLAYPNEELPAARPVRRSPIYEQLKAAGAVMGANFGLENALWFAPPGVPPSETPTYRRSEAFPIVREECRAVRSAVGLYETTNYGKYEVTGRGARAWLDRVFACRIPRPGRLALAPMLNPAGRIVGDLSMACLAEDRFMIVGSGFAEEFHLRWFWAAQPPPDVFVRSTASTLAGFSVAGPRARELVQRLVRDDLSAGALRLFQVRETAVGFAPAILTRAGFTGELGYEIWTTPDYFASLYDDLREAGRGLGLVHFGGRALSSLRLEKGYGSFNKDFRPDYTPGETGLDRFIDFEKPEFTGRAAALAERAAGARRRFVIMEVAGADPEVIGYESIMKDGRTATAWTGASPPATCRPRSRTRARASRSISSARCVPRPCGSSRSTTRRVCDYAADGGALTRGCESAACPQPQPSVRSLSPRLADDDLALHPGHTIGGAGDVHHPVCRLL
jgi:dimethylglycine dehydrogenase